MAVTKPKPLPDLLCPRCGHTDTVPLRNYGFPIDGDTPNSSLWWCMECRHRFEGPKVSR